MKVATAAAVGLILGASSAHAASWQASPKYNEASGDAFCLVSDKDKPPNSLMVGMMLPRKIGTVIIMINPVDRVKDSSPIYIKIDRARFSGTHGDAFSWQADKLLEALSSGSEYWMSWSREEGGLAEAHGALSGIAHAIAACKAELFKKRD